MKKSVPTAYSQLYDEAEAQLTDDSVNADEALCPLYHALERIDRRYGDGELIGKGGMKEVLRIYDERTERYVALARPKEGMGVERFDSFLREAHITARLEHPNIIKLFDMGIDDERRPFFTMEFKRGQSLRKILSSLRKGKLGESYPYEVRLSIFVRVCEAMGYAHSRKVLHLDLKPENIQVGTFGEVQVCDWGMGEIERNEGDELESVALLDPDLYGDQLEVAVKGTPGYMAPEQKNPKETKTPATDIYAMGCLLYELTMLKGPGKRAEVPVSSPAIAAIVNKACADDPGERYASVDLMRADVRRHLMGFSAEVENAGFLREVRLFYRRNRQACLISLFFTMLVVGTAVWFTQKLQGSYDQTATALGETQEALGSADEARRRAEDALVRHQQERDFAFALFENRDEDPFANARFLIDFLMVKEAISLPVIENALLAMDRELAEESEIDNRLWSLKAYVLFMVQRFEEAERFYAIRVGDHGPIRAQIPEFASLVGEDGLLPVNDFIRLLNNLSKDRRSRYPLMEKMIIYDSLKRESPVKTARILEAMLMLSNPEWKDGVFEFRPKNASLRLSGTGLRSLYRSGARRDEKEVPVRSLLRLLPIRSLDIRGSEIDDLWHLEGLELEQLDIRGTGVEDLEPLNGMLSLRQLTVDPGQFDSDQLAVLRGLVEVTEVSGSGN
ncbi:protein kinase domain-containing protein [Haloferula sp.]|uniref:protein kinase domain-containing protein n=1 Tax=Haloferula sp. TaxID=2497595 RepID=UPI00329E0FC5